MAYNLNAKVNVLKNGNERVTSDFGMRTLTIKGVTKTKKHNGIDIISSKYGTDYITAFESGTVIDTRNNIKGYSETYSAGNYIKIKHNNNYITVYYHLEKDSLRVETGAKVKKGQVIAYMGTTGWSSGNHLHFGIQKNGVFINPKPYLLGDKAITSNNYKTLYTMKVRNGVWGSQKKVKDLTTDGKKNATSQNKEAYACYKKGTVFTAKRIINHTDGSVWAEGYSGYICIKDKTKTYCEKL